MSAVRSPRGNSALMPFAVSAATLPWNNAFILALVIQSAIRCCSSRSVSGPSAESHDSRYRAGSHPEPWRATTTRHRRAGHCEVVPIGALIEEIRFADDSPVEGAGFEPRSPRLG
jgi:hypothetical protein